MSKRYAIGDIHARSLEFEKILEKLNFNFEEDEMILLGDVFDRGPDPIGVINILKKIKNLKWVMGNHDETTIDWLKDMKDLGKFVPYSWGSTKFGGETQRIIKGLSMTERIELLDFCKSKTVDYYIDEENNLFTHAGLNVSIPIEKNHSEFLRWDRSFIKKVILENSTKGLNLFKHIYVGHTPTFTFRIKHTGKWGLSEGVSNILTPITVNNVTNLDTGGGFSFGRLSVINLETKEIIQQNIITE